MVSVLCDSVRCVRQWRMEKASGSADKSLSDKSRAAGKKKEAS